MSLILNQDIGTSAIGATISRKNEGTQSIPNNITDGTVVIFPNSGPASEINISGAGITYDNVTGRFTNTSGKKCAFLINYQIIFPASSAGWRAAWIRHNGDAADRFAVSVIIPSDATGIPLKGSCILSPENGAYFQICANQNSGAAISIGGAAAGVLAGAATRIMVTRLTQ